MSVHHLTMEDKLFIENPLDLPSTFSRNIQDEFVYFSSTPLFDLLDHEDVNEIIDFSDRGYSDPFAPILNYDDDSIKVDFSKLSFYDDLSNDEVETP